MKHYQFRCDDQMWPSQINASWPGAQFVARGWIAAKAGDETGSGLVDADPIWGVLIEVPGETDSVDLVSVQTDDGRHFEALISAPLPAGDLQALLAVSRYWELPPTFIGHLKQALAAVGTLVEDEEPRDDAQLP